MSIIRLIFSLIISLAVIVVTSAFALRNDSEIMLDFIVFESWSMSIGLWLLASFFFGGCLVFIVLWPFLLKQQFINSRNNKKLQQTEKSQVKGDLIKGS